MGSGSGVINASGVDFKKHSKFIARQMSVVSCWLLLWHHIFFSNYDCIDLQLKSISALCEIGTRSSEVTVSMLWHNAANQTRNTMANPFSFPKCTGFFYLRHIDRNNNCTCHCSILVHHISKRQHGIANQRKNFWLAKTHPSSIVEAILNNIIWS